MKDATPKEDDTLLFPEKASQQDLELIKEVGSFFSTDNGYYLDKALVFLHQFLAGRPDKRVLDKKLGLIYKPKRIKIGEIQGLSPVEITIVMQYLNDAFLQPVIQKVDMYNTPRFDDDGRLIRSAEFILENTEFLDTAIVLLEDLKADKQKYLVFREDIFIYNGSVLKINAGTYPYSFLKVIYEHLDGKSGDISYTDISNEMRKIDKYKNENDNDLKEKLQKYVTAKEEVLGKKLKPVELNGKPLLKIIKDFGISFNNG
jgi:hypothetical protein